MIYKLYFFGLLKGKLFKTSLMVLIFCCSTYNSSISAKAESNIKKESSYIDNTIFDDNDD